jgi:holo-[acyl-carrier protein] synthase
MQFGSICEIAARQFRGRERLRVGFDLVEVSRIRESLDSFGERFLRRLFSDEEIAYAMQVDALSAQRLAARFAAKEAAIKAFALSEVGVGWRDIEVRKQADGGCQLALHGKAASRASQWGVSGIALSLSHEGAYAGAVVTAICNASAGEDQTQSLFL